MFSAVEVTIDSKVGPCCAHILSGVELRPSRSRRNRIRSADSSLRAAKQQLHYYFTTLPTPKTDPLTSRQYHVKLGPLRPGVCDGGRAREEEMRCEMMLRSGAASARALARFHFVIFSLL
jgi:hypothetical protein